jgi:hypothetical protein
MTPVGAELVPRETFSECPDCTGPMWFFGPRGGASINLGCLTLRRLAQRGFAAALHQAN